MDGIHLLLVMLMVIAAALMYLNRPGRRPRRAVRVSRSARKERATAPQGTYVEELSARLSPGASHQWRELVSMSMGDRARAKRLVMLEHSRMPGADIEQAVANALEKWRRDLR